ncbi:MAG: hypothetical protein KGO81_10780 [Bacteroidota bacterium]|nr:hypothetical protein [Bacteroidota bacterium]
MKKLALIGVLIFMTRLPCQSQTYWTAKTPLLNYLYSLQKPISSINSIEQKEYLPIYQNKKNKNQHLIKNSKGLYILVNGTGQVYKALDTTSKQMAFIRIDSTIDFGANYRAIDFSYNDTLFSYGGYGFWHTNGLLRYFGKENEWHNYQLDKEYPIINSIFSYIPNTSTLFAVQSETPDLIKNYTPSSTPFIMKLDLLNKEDKIIGTLSSQLVNKHLNSNYLIANLDFFKTALIIYFRDEDASAINFSENKVYRLNAKKLQELFKYSNKYIECFFTINNTLYYSYSDNSIDSTKFLATDFSLESYPAYKRINNVQYLWASILLFPLLIGSLFYGFKKVKNKEKIVTPKPKYSSVSEEIEFTDLDDLLICLIFSKSEKNIFSSVEEVNRCLGIQKKALEVQKRIRNEVVHKINHKFRVICKQESDLIERIRKSDDRRYFLYLIQEDNFRLYKKYVKR